ncbi:MAG: type II toxin-antitoxin system ParD family antitoxin [Cellvibrio sp.]
MNVSLTAQLESYIQQKVASGMYNSASEVMREALRLMAEKDAIHTIKLESLRKDVQQGLHSLDSGEGKELDINAIKAKARSTRI